MKPTTEQIHNDVIDYLDTLIAHANEAKENFVLKRYEEVAANLDEVAGAGKRAEALINKMWE